AHQWRQPLNRINLSLEVIDTVVEDPIIDKQIIQKKIQNAQKNLKYMSNTIEDFTNFFHPNKHMVEIDIVEIMNKSIELIGTRLSNIELNISSLDKVIYKTYENELIQVLLIVLNNAIDNFDIKNTINPKIDIIITLKDNLTIEIVDNGGGVPKDVILKIFEPYFTTKFKSEGTGLGLYMAKMIVEDSMKGKLEFASNSYGVTFKIIL
ncbi:MAG: HAMP domain-containing histidine kinase, partial [Arcobacteraceae bacterium]|nr:HAMP domain-containing histidine kinase [Arcobacteraceae bacterium]